MDYLKILITVVIAVLGWILAHYFTSRRDIANKRRELRTKYLMNAYEVFASEISNRPPSEDRARLIENTVAKVQLVGIEHHIQLVKKLCEDICNNNEFKLDPIINALRKDLRQNLGLPDIKENVKWIRFIVKNSKSLYREHSLETMVHLRPYSMEFLAVESIKQANEHLTNVHASGSLIEKRT